MKQSKSEQAYEAALQVLPGGVNSPVRAFRAVGGTPFFAHRGQGPHLFDIDGNHYIDYLLSWGPLIWGHAHPRIIDAITRTASNGTSFGVPTELETAMALLVMELMPSIEKIRMVNSGTEATMSALRLARAYTGRTQILKFEGCYHGHADPLLVRAGSGVATFGLPDSPGVLASTAQATITVPYNDVDALRAAFSAHGEHIAAVIIEPVVGNMGCILPQPGYLQAVRDITAAHGTVLIFDEVMTGFRVGLGGAQVRYGITPDITTLGKVIGGGLPVGAFGGKREIMEMIAPEGPVYQAGTLSGNPLAMVAGYTALEMLKEANRSDIYDQMEQNGQALVDEFVTEGYARGIPVSGHAIGGMFGMFFHPGPIHNFTAAIQCDTARYAKFFHLLLKAGVSLAPSQLESGFMSAVHGTADIEQTQEAIRQAFTQL